MRTMKLYLSPLALLLLVACSQPLTAAQEEYKSFCKETDGMWMKMAELHEGEPTGKSCYGCMQDEENHFCTKEEYEAML